MKRPWSCALLALLAAAAALPQARAGQCRPVIDGGWLRASPAGAAMPMAAGYMRIRNPCPAGITVVSVSSPAFADVSLHRTETVDGMASMRAVPALPIAAGQTVRLAPGGLHLMLMQPLGMVTPGSKVPVRLHLQQGADVEAVLAVLAPGAQAPAEAP